MVTQILKICELLIFLIWKETRHALNSKHSGASIIRAHRDSPSPGYAINTDNELNDIFYHQFLINFWKIILFFSKNNPVFINFMFFQWEYLKFAMIYNVFCYDNVIRITAVSNILLINILAMSPLYWTVISQQHGLTDCRIKGTRINGAPL